MLGFILSKMNLLILVTAIFAIVSFFAFGLADIAKVKEAGDLASRISEKSKSLSNSPSYCFSDTYYLDDSLETAGGSFYYVIKISKREIPADPKPVNALIFSIYDREEIKRSFERTDYEAKAIAADSFRTNAELHIYSQDYDGTAYSRSPFESDTGYIYVDPQAVVPVDAIEFVKEIENGQPKLYVIACSSARCLADKTSIGESIHPPTLTEAGGFRC